MGCRGCGPGAEPPPGRGFSQGRGFPQGRAFSGSQPPISSLPSSSSPTGQLGRGFQTRIGKPGDLGLPTPLLPRSTQRRPCQLRAACHCPHPGPEPPISPQGTDFICNSSVDPVVEVFTCQGIVENSIVGLSLGAVRGGEPSHPGGTGPPQQSLPGEQCGAEHCGRGETSLTIIWPLAKQTSKQEQQETVPAWGRGYRDPKLLQYIG